jgi:hypothetical protein
MACYRANITFFYCAEVNKCKRGCGSDIDVTYDTCNADNSSLKKDADNYQ